MLVASPTWRLWLDSWKGKA